MIGKFIIRFTIFMALSFGLLGIVTLYNYNAIGYGPDLKSRNLIMGDSHMMNGLNPKVFDDWVFLCNKGEPYTMTYMKLKYMLENGNSIDTLILGFGHQNISTFNDDKLLSGRSIEHFQRNYAVLLGADFETIPYDKRRLRITLLKKLALIPNPSPFESLGFINENERQVDLNGNVMMPIKRHYYHGEEQADRSVLSVDYLRRILNLAEANDIFVALVGTPVVDRYYDLIPEDFIEYYDEVKDEIDSVYPNVKIYNYISSEMDPKYFLDFDHLNYSGSLEFSTILKDLLVNSTE